MLKHALSKFVNQSPAVRCGFAKPGDKPVPSGEGEGNSAAAFTPSLFLLPTHEAYNTLLTTASQKPRAISQGYHTFSQHN
jgi:hypothetical protein